MQPTIEHSHFGPRNVRPLQMGMDSVSAYQSLKRIGIGFDDKNVRAMMNYFAMDALQPTQTTASINTPIQFLQNFLPGFVAVMTAARKIDELVGITTSGSWEDEEVVQGIKELTGTSVPYGDYTNVPLSSWNTNFERFTVVRFEEGLRVGALEEARASRMRIDSGAEKRNSAGLALEIQRNKVGFYGYNNGTGRTYGFLNAPGLPAYVANPGPAWASATWQEITGDLRAGFVALRAASKDTIDPTKTPITIAIASSCVDYLSKATDFGITVWDWLKQSYPMARVESAPELDLANGGANVFYMYAEKVNDNSSDDGRVFSQVVPAKFQVVGVAKEAKAYVEDYVNATAGVFCKRPYAVVRFTGI